MSKEKYAGNLYNYGIVPQKCSRFLFLRALSLSFLDIVVFVAAVVVVVFNFQFSFHTFLWPPFWQKWSSCRHISMAFSLPTAFFTVFRISLWNYSKNNEKQSSRKNVFLCWWNGVSFSHNAISIMYRFEMCGSSEREKNWTLSSTHSTDKQWMYVKTQTTSEKATIHKQIGQTNIISMVFCYMRIQDSRIERATTAWCKLTIRTVSHTRVRAHRSFRCAIAYFSAIHKYNNVFTIHCHTKAAKCLLLR